MKHIHCPVNGWDCPYYIDCKVLPSDDGEQEEYCLCGLDNPIDECGDFLSFWEGYSEDEYTDDTNY